MKKIVVLAFLTACGTDMAGIGDFDAPPDADVENVARGRFPGLPDAHEETPVVDGGQPSPDVGESPPDVAVSLPPDSRRLGMPCETSSECGLHAGRCEDGRCTACVGAECGECADGATEGLACPVRGTTASACGYCVDDPAVWCDRQHPCSQGPCNAPDCR